MRVVSSRQSRHLARPRFAPYTHPTPLPRPPPTLPPRLPPAPCPPPTAIAPRQVGSTLLAQAAGVPTLPWSGSGVQVPFEECAGGAIPPAVYRRACIETVEEALAACRTIGYPVMLKASWGGGGKGIRKVGRR